MVHVARKEDHRVESTHHKEGLMGINIRPTEWTIILCVCVAVIQSDMTLAKDKKLTPEEVVAEHVKSIGGPEALADIKSRAFNGSASVEFITGTTGLIAGQFEFVSEKQKLGIFYRYDALEYPGEHFAFDGKDVTVSYISPGRRSPLGDFLYRYDDILKHGLLGGVLSVNWALLNLDRDQAGMKYREKKVDGRELHELEYRPKKGMRDVKVKLYFDYDTFRHVRTEYKVSITDQGNIQSIPKVTNPTSGKGRPTMDVLSDSVDVDSYYVLTEEYGDFTEIDGLTLPQSYSIHYSREGRGGSFMARWTMKALRWSHNTPINPQFYRVQ
jgi:hypothetical protein